MALAFDSERPSNLIQSGPRIWLRGPPPHTHIYRERHTHRHREKHTHTVTIQLLFYFLYFFTNLAFYPLQYPNFVNIRTLYGAISSDKREFTVINEIYKYIYTLFTGIHYIIILDLIDNYDYNCISAGSIAVYYSLSLESSLTSILPMSHTLNAEQELYSGMGLVPNKNS